MSYTGTTWVCEQNFAAVRRAVLEEIAKQQDHEGVHCPPIVSAQRDDNFDLYPDYQSDNGWETNVRGVHHALSQGRTWPGLQ